jgi:TRAP-type C4-dicarboxylate transport system substrate-binding protein
MTIHRRGLFQAAGAGLVLSAVGARSARAATTLNLSSILPDSNFQVRNAKKFGEAVEKATTGDVIFNVRSGGSLGFKGPEQLRAVRDGLVPAADILTAQQIGDEPLFGAEGVPFLVKSQEELRTLHKFLRPEFEKAAARYNQKILYMVPSPFQYMFLKVKVSDVAGLRGIKIRGADKNTVDTCIAVGMAGVQIPFGELIPALASGRVDAVATSAATAVDAKFWEFMKFAYPTNHTWSCNMVNINLDTWKRISPASQKAIEDIAKSLEPEFWSVSAADDAQSISVLRSHGMEVVAVSDKMSADMWKMAASLTDQYLERVPAARPVFREYLAATGRA